MHFPGKQKPRWAVENKTVSSAGISSLRTAADLARASMAAARTTWLSPRFDRANVLSKAIKVSPLFAPRDGWRFDDHDEKQYIDPEKNCHSSYVTNIHGAVAASSLIAGRTEAFFFLSLSLPSGDK